MGNDLYSSYSSYSSVSRKVDIDIRKENVINTINDFISTNHNDFQPSLSLSSSRKDMKMKMKNVNIFHWEITKSFIQQIKLSNYSTYVELNATESDKKSFEIIIDELSQLINTGVGLNIKGIEMGMRMGMGMRKKENDYQLRGNVYYLLGKYSKACKDYSESIALTPLNENYLVYFDRAIAYQRMTGLNNNNNNDNNNDNDDDDSTSNDDIRNEMKNISEKSIADFTQVIELNPRFYPGYFFRGVEYFKNKKFTRSIDDFSSCLLLNPDLLYFKYQSFNKRGLSLRKLNCDNEAIEQFSNALDIKKDNYEAANYIGEIYFEYNNFKKALKYFNSSIDMCSSFGRSYYYRGLTYAKMKQYEKSREDFSKAVKYDEKFDVTIKLVNEKQQQKE